MAKLRDVIVYICEKYPFQDELSKARLTKMIYLADWKSAIEHEAQITGLSWEFSHYGPYVDDVAEVAREDIDLEVVQTNNLYGAVKEIIRLRQEPREAPNLSASEKEVLDFVITTTAKKYWNDFIKLIYSTYPIATQPRYSELKLVELAKQYKDQQALLE